MTELGHVVHYVRNLEASLKFYHAGVGLEVRGKIFDGRAVLLTGGRTHHELLLIQVGEATIPLAARRIGLYHVGWKIDESLQDLRQARDSILEQGYQIDGLSDHTVSQSIYLRDPDGNEVEWFVDNPEFDWESDTS